MTLRTPIAALLLSALLAAPTFAQDEPKPEGGQPAEQNSEDPKNKAESEVKENEEEAKEESKEAEQEATKANLEANVSKAQADQAAKLAADSKAAAEAADKKVVDAQAALDAAEEAADEAKEAAAADGATPEQKQVATDAEAALKAAEMALTAAKILAGAAHENAERLQEEADAALEAREKADEEAEAAKQAKADAEAKAKAAEAAKKAMEAAAQMKRGPKVPVDVLKLQLTPLTKAELEAEVQEWIKALKTKVTGISYAEIAIKTAEGEQKEQVLEALTKLRADRTALIDRVNVVLAAYRKKGGTTEDQELYLSAVSGITVDVKDASAAWTTITGWLKSPEGGLRWAKNLGLFLFTLLAFKILGSIVGGIVSRTMGAMRVKTSALLQDFFVNVIRKGIFFLGLVVALSMLEVNIGPFLAAMGGAAFVIGFALQGTLSNFAAGVMILMYRPYDIGDLVEVSGATGVVNAMSLVSTSLKTPDNQIVVIPNGSIWGGIITNRTGLQKRRVDLVFGIGYDDDIAKSEAILKEVVEKHEKVLQDPAPVIKLHELADSSVNFVCRPWVMTGDYWDVYWDVTRAVKERFDAEGISIPYPQTDVHIHQVAASEPATAGASS